MRKLLMVIAAVLMISGVQAQFNPAEFNPMNPIPNDPAIRTGRLENGMTYYIRHNEKPKGQADFHILHNVGAIQEADDQQGLAHFLEHMAFNGTKNLKGKEMLNYLETIGVKFGTNLNASTSWDQTKYMIKDVPTTRQGIIDTAMLILHDWSHFIALEGDEIDSERGVIMEELRSRDGAGFRSSMEFVKSIGKGTKYEHRNIIGYLDYLKSFPHEMLRNFYHTWYRPDYQAVIIVGDIDVDKTEQALIKLMSDIPAPAADAPQKEVIVVPDNQEPIISIYTDPEMEGTKASVIIKRPAMPREANGLVIRELQDMMLYYATSMLSARFTDISQTPDAPFLHAMAFDGPVGIVPTMVVTGLDVYTEDGKFMPGFEALLTETERARRYGFTESEFERMQNEMKSMTLRTYANRDARKNNDFIAPIMANYQIGTPVPDAEYTWKLDSMLLDMITVQDINTVLPQLIQPTNWVIAFTAPEKEGIVNPTAEELLATIEKVRNSEITAHEDNTVKEPLIANTKALKGSSVKQTAANEVLGTTEWTLKNGARIIVKPTTFKNDEVRLAVKSKGGLSLISNDEYFTAQFMPEIMKVSGLSKFSASDLRKQLSGNTASMSLAINNYDHGMGGSSSPKDIETMLQLLYLNFTAPRFNETDYNTYMKQTRAQFENLLKNPDYIVQSALYKTVFNNNYRTQLPSPEILDGIKYNELKSVYDKLYNGANNFTFTFVGNVDMATLKPLVEKYIGSLPASKTKLQSVDDNIRPVKGKVDNLFRTPMMQPKVSVWYYISGEVPFTIENRLLMTFLAQALDSRYLVSIREEKGGTYGVTVQGSTSPEPVADYSLVVAFDTNEQMADELQQIIVAELEKIAAEGPQSADIEKTREFLAKSWKNILEENSGWMTNLDRYYFLGLDYISNYEKTLQSITTADIQKFAQKVLADGNMVRVVMSPEVAAE